MHGLQACLFKYITVAAFRIYVQYCEDAAKWGGWRPFIKKSWKLHCYHGKSWKNDGIVFLNFCGNPEV